MMLPYIALVALLPTALVLFPGVASSQSPDSSRQNELRLRYGRGLTSADLTFFTFNDEMQCDAAVSQEREGNILSGIDRQFFGPLFTKYIMRSAYTRTYSFLFKSVTATLEAQWQSLTSSTLLQRYDERTYRGSLETSVASSAPYTLDANVCFVHERAITSHHTETQTATTFTTELVHRCQAFPDLTIDASVRYDLPIGDAGVWSPRVSLSYALSGDFSVRAAYAIETTGPTIQQDHLDHRDPQFAVAVVGAARAGDWLREQAAAGHASVLIDPARLDVGLANEESRVLEIETIISPFEGCSLSATFIRGRVFDLIEMIPIAIVSGDPVYSYINFAHISTQVLRMSCTVSATEWLEFSGEYVLNDSRDADEYSGLFRRPLHAGRCSVALTHAATEGHLELVGRFSSRVGDLDRNGNGILDTDNEFARGFAVWDVYFGIPIVSSVSLEATLQNALGYEDRARVDLLPRSFAVGAAYKF